jgi:hypothetical protein
MDMTLRDQGSGGAVLLLRDASTPYYYPAPSVGAARVVLYARDKGKGVDTAFIVAEGKPGGEFSIPYAALTGRTLLFATVTYSATGTPSVSNLEHADWQELDVAANTGTAAGFDEHVPTVTTAPTITKAENSSEWIVFTPAPDDNGSTLTGCDIHVEKSSDATVFDDWLMLPASSSHRIDQKTFACRIKYRWRNQSTEDAGTGRGISAWSPTATAAEIGAAIPNPSPSSILTTFDPDPNDARAGRETGVLT